MQLNSKCNILHRQFANEIIISHRFNTTCLIYNKYFTTHANVATPVDGGAYIYKPVYIHTIEIQQHKIGTHEAKPGN